MLDIELKKRANLRSVLTLVLVTEFALGYPQVPQASVANKVMLSLRSRKCLHFIIYRSQCNKCFYFWTNLQYTFDIICLTLSDIFVQ